jgi:hypothetical protein
LEAGRGAAPNASKPPGCAPALGDVLFPNGSNGFAAAAGAAAGVPKGSNAAAGAGAGVPNGSKFAAEDVGAGPNGSKAAGAGAGAGAGPPKASNVAAGAGAGPANASNMAAGAAFFGVGPAPGTGELKGSEFAVDAPGGTGEEKGSSLMLSKSIPRAEEEARLSWYTHMQSRKKFKNRQF